MLCEDDLAFYEHLQPEARPDFLRNIEEDNADTENDSDDGDDDEDDGGDNL